MEITENKRFYRFTLLHLALLALVLLFAAVSCTHSDAKKANEEKTAAPLIPAVEVFTMHKTRMTSALTVPGELLAFQQVDLYAKVNSFVQKLNADVGTEVQAGQLLATLEAPELGAQLAGAEARVQAQEAL
ncbi:MAG: biotin/lipoyl-binding protein, partial [Bacteroidota bacterium]